MGTFHFKTKPHLWHHSPLTPASTPSAPAALTTFIPSDLDQTPLSLTCDCSGLLPAPPPWHTTVYCPHRSRSDPVKIYVLVTSDPFSKTVASKTGTSHSLPLASTTLPLACSPALSWILDGWLLHEHYPGSLHMLFPGIPTSMVSFMKLPHHCSNVTFSLRPSSTIVFMTVITSPQSSFCSLPALFFFTALFAF